MRTNENILVIGCGGIGSYAIETIAHNIFHRQYPESIGVDIVDFDEVEMKNTKYQNFKDEDVGKKKTEALGDRFIEVNPEEKKIESTDDLKDYSCIVLCVDNPQVRALVFEYCFENDVYFIDARADGRLTALYCKEGESSLDKMMKTIDLSQEAGSCQMPFEFDAGIIQNGNRIIGQAVAQALLNWIRETPNQEQFIRMW